MYDLGNFYAAAGLKV